MESNILRAAILICVFVAVLLVAETLIRSIRSSRGRSRAMNERLALIAKGFSREQVMARLRRANGPGIVLPGPLGAIARRLEAGLAGASLNISAPTLLLYLVIATVAVFSGTAFAAIAGGFTLDVSKFLLLGSFAVSIGFGLPMMLLSRIADRRRRKLEQQFPVALDVFVRGLRAGHPIAAALELLTQEMTDPIGSEFGLVVDEVTYGADIREALSNMADRCGLQDMHMFVVSLSVQSETGGNLAEILENLSKVIRERASMMMKVRALSAEGRMTAVMLTALPILAFSALFLMRPSFYLEVSNDPIFFPSFTALVGLYAIGFYSIRRLVDLKV